MGIIGKLKELLTYHGRSGHPLVHKSKSGRKFIMVRKRGGGTKRLYDGSRYHPGPEGRRGKPRRLEL